MRRSDRGSSPVPFIIFLLLWLVAAYFTYTYQEEYEKQRQKVIANKIENLSLGENVPTLKARIKELDKSILEVKRIIGYGKGKDSGQLEPTQVISNARKTLDAYFLNIADKGKEQVLTVGDGKQVQLMVNGQFIAVPLAGGKLDEAENLLKKQNRLNLQEVMNKLQWVYDQLISHQKALERDIAARKQALAAETGAQGDRISQLEGEITKYDGLIKSEQSVASEEAQKLQAKIDELNSTRDRLEQDTSRFEEKQKEIKRKGKTESIKLNNQIKEAYRQRANLREQLSSMRVARRDTSRLTNEDLRARVIETDEPDGEVAYASSTTVFLNIGRTNKVIPGLKFFVYSPGISGSWTYRGKVQVIKVGPDTAECRVLDLKSKFNPISRGDKIFNKLFRTPTEMFSKGPLRLVFLGTTRKSEKEMRYIKKQLERIGVQVQEKMTHWTELLVVDREYESDPDYKRGRKDLNIEEIKLDQLTEFLKY